MCYYTGNMKGSLFQKHESQYHDCFYTTGPLETFKQPKTAGPEYGAARLVAMEAPTIVGSKGLGSFQESGALI